MSTVREIMTSEPICIASDSPIEDAARLMRQHDVGVLPVMDGETLRGLITDRDIVVRAVAEGRFDEQVGSIISAGIITVSPNDDVKKATELMSESDVRRLPVCDDGRLVGIVSVGDIATRGNANSAGTVMEQTGPEA